MNVGYINFDADKNIDEKLGLCLEFLDGKPNFDYSFLTSLKKYSDEGRLTASQELAIEKIYNGWNVAMLAKDKEGEIIEKSKKHRKKGNEKLLNEKYNKMMNILEGCPTTTIKTEKDCE